MTYIVSSGALNSTHSLTHALSCFLPLILTTLRAEKQEVRTKTATVSGPVLCWYKFITHVDKNRKKSLDNDKKRQNSKTCCRNHKMLQPATFSRIRNQGRKSTKKGGGGGPDQGPIEFPPLSSFPFPFTSLLRVPLDPARSLGKRGKFTQQGLGQRTSRYRIW